MRTRANCHSWPATRDDGFVEGADIPCEGQRFRLDPTFDVTTLTSPAARVIARAMQEYGLIMTDKAGALVTYAEDPRLYMPPGGGPDTDPYTLLFDPDNLVPDGVEKYVLLSEIPVNRLQALPLDYGKPCDDGAAHPPGRRPTSGVSGGTGQRVDGRRNGSPAVGACRYIRPMATDVSRETAVATPATGRPTAGYATSLVLAVLGVWFTVGLMLDAWAHNNIPQLETFFTPWHAAFYSGFAATAGWVLWTCRAAILDGQRALDAVPIGYGATLVGLVTFALSGVGDLVWHTALGIEQDINILFSPTHVGLVASMLVIVTTPLRTAWADPGLPEAPGLRRLLPAVLATAFAATLALLFMQYANALTYGPFGVIFALSNQDSRETSRFVAEVAVTTALVVVPLLTLARSWRLPVGATTILYVALGGLSTAVRGFENLDLIAGFLLAGLVAEGLVAALRPARAGSPSCACSPPSCR
ncbi:hypothetical protein ACFQX7_32390 [Luedemannella flava]